MNAKGGVEEPRTYTYTDIRIYTYKYIYSRTNAAYLSDRRVAYTLAHSLAHSSPELIDRFSSYQRFAQDILVSR